MLSALQEGFQGTGAALELDSNSLSIVVPAPGLDVVPEHAGGNADRPPFAAQDDQD